MAYCVQHNSSISNIPSVNATSEFFDYENTDRGTILEGYGADNGHICGLSPSNEGITTISAKRIRDEFVANKVFANTIIP